MNSEIKEKIKERYGRIALVGNTDCCCMPSSSSNCCSNNNNNDIDINENSSLLSSVKSIGYDAKELESISKSSILGVGCGNPIKFAYIKEGDTVVDFGSGAGIDVFLLQTLSNNKIKQLGLA